MFIFDEYMFWLMLYASALGCLACALYDWITPVKPYSAPSEPTV